MKMKKILFHLVTKEKGILLQNFRTGTFQFCYGLACGRDITWKCTIVKTATKLALRATFWSTWFKNFNPWLKSSFILVSKIWKFSWLKILITRRCSNQLLWFWCWNLGSKLIDFKTFLKNWNNKILRLINIILLLTNIVSN